MFSPPVETILSRLSSVHRSGGGARARCPAHDDQHASLSIAEGEDGCALVNCFAGCSVDEVVARLGLALSDLFPTNKARIVAADYEYRDETEKLRYVVVRYAPKDFRQKRPDGKGGWIWDLKGVAPLPYRLPELTAADTNEPVLIPEGEKDVDRLVTLGFVSTTNSGGAGKWKPELSRYLKKRNVVILPDNDEPGRKHARQVAESLQGIASSISIVELPGLPVKGDVSDWIVSGGTPAQLRSMIAAAPPVDAATTIPGVVEHDRLLRDVLALYETGLKPGVSTGIPSLDCHFTAKRGELTVFTGIPGAGKTNFVDQLAVNIAQQEEWRFAVFSAENYPTARHAANLLEKAVGKPFSVGPSGRMSLQEVRSAALILEYCFRFMDPPEEDQNVDGLLRIISALANRERVDAAILDPWNELDHSRPSGMTETEHVSVSLSKIRRFARERSLAFWIVAHPTKLVKEGGKYPVPTPYDISGSAHWRNKADNCITVWRDTSDGDKPEVQVHIQKIRFREVGRIGMVPLHYDKVTGRYTDSRPAPWESA